MLKVRLLRDWNGKKAGAEFDATPRWFVFAKRQGLAEEVKKKKSTAKTEPKSEKEE